jgi:hypothetical protein
VSEPDYKALFAELVKRLTEEEMVRLVWRCERATKQETPLSAYLRLEVKKRRREEGMWPGAAALS